MAIGRSGCRLLLLLLRSTGPLCLDPQLSLRLGPLDLLGHRPLRVPVENASVLVAHAPRDRPAVHTLELLDESEELGAGRQVGRLTKLGGRRCFEEAADCRAQDDAEGEARGQLDELRPRERLRQPTGDEVRSEGDVQVWVLEHHAVYLLRVPFPEASLEGASADPDAWDLPV